jgi:hypothetical protein
MNPVNCLHPERRTPIGLPRTANVVVPAFPGPSRSALIGVAPLKSLRTLELEFSKLLVGASERIPRIVLPV